MTTPLTLNAEMVEFLCDPIIVETIVGETASGRVYLAIRKASHSYYWKNRETILEKTRLKRLEKGTTKTPGKVGRPRRDVVADPPLFVA
jgi:hypothetical protein